MVFQIIKESIASLQRAEARIRSGSRAGGSISTDPDLFMIKNLLILKNELVTLEIGDVRGQTGPGMSLMGNMQHFAQIWDTLRPQNLLGGLLSSFGSLSTYIPGSSLWSRSASNTGGTPASSTPRVGAAEVHDASEQLDGLLRQSIHAFTRRWAGVLNEGRGGAAGAGGRLGGKNVAKAERELDEMLERAFGGQPEVVGKLKEAIQIEVQAQLQAQGEKKSYVRRV